MDHAAFLNRLFEEVINRGNLEVADEMMDPDYVDHGPMGDMRGVEAFKQMVGLWRAAVPDVHCEVTDVFAEGDRVGWLVRTTGTHSGEMMGIPPSGKRIDLVSPNIGVFRDGRALEHWADQSMFQFMMQIGAIPAPQGAPVA